MLKHLILFLPLLTLFSCTERITEVNDLHGYRLDNIKPSTRDSLTFLYDSLRSTLNDGNDFLDGVSLVIVDKFVHLRGDNSFERYLKTRKRIGTGKICGMSFYSDSLLPKTIAISEKSHSVNDAIGYWLYSGRYPIIPVLRHSLMHEIGHQFDEYFGHDYKAKFALDFDSIQLIRETDPYRNPYSFTDKNEYESTVGKLYIANNCLSDKPGLKMAIQKDYVEMTDKMLADDLSLPSNMKYYSKGIDFAMDITPEMVDGADRAREEVYANLFSYAMGENDGEKYDFLATFPNSYEVVKDDIKHFIQSE